MTWAITLLAIHILLAYGAAAIYCTAPDWLQKVVLGIVMCSALILIYDYAAQLIGDLHHWRLRRAALEAEHIAVVLYLFRLYFIERMSCRNLLPERRR